MGTAFKIFVLCGLCLLSGALTCCWVHDESKREGIAEGWKNGREYEREIWERKPPPEPKVIEKVVEKIVLQPNPEKETVYIEIPKIQTVETQKVITEAKVYQVRTGCVGGCKCNETGEEP